MTPNDIKAAIAKAGTTQTAIAHHLNVRPKSVGQVIAGKLRSTKIEAELAKVTGKPIHAKPPQRGRPRTSWSGDVRRAA